LKCGGGYHRRRLSYPPPSFVSWSTHRRRFHPLPVGNGILRRVSPLLPALRIPSINRSIDLDFDLKEDVTKILFMNIKIDTMN
jgi:hypothetical protein